MTRPIQFGDVATVQDWFAAPLTEAIRLTKRGTLPPPTSSTKSAPTHAMPVDVFSNHSQAMVVAALPGVHPDDIDVSVHRNTATIRATVRASYVPEQSSEVTWYVSELARGSFERSIAFPFAINEQAVEAQFVNGMLRLVLPRREQDRPQRIPVKVGGITPRSVDAAIKEPQSDMTMEAQSETVAD